VKLIIDENLPPSWRDFLAPFGITATHWRDIGNIGDPDDVIFDYADSHGAIIVSQDLDFTRLLALRGSRLPSVIQLRVQCPTPEIIGRALLSVLETHQEQLQDGCLISLDLKRHRLRLLPLRG
jgi:predicted nuclease of predicted toxin-antitoxin system